MQGTSSLPIEASPLLFRHAAPRTSSDDLPGQYDHERQLWVIETDQGLVPLVEAGQSNTLETSTSTRVRQEGDDDDQGGLRQLCTTLLDTSTLTKVRQEGSDDDFSTEDQQPSALSFGTLAALKTKTFVGQEGDDQDIAASGLLELETRSLNNQEGIDDDWPRMMLDLQGTAPSSFEDSDDRSFAH